MNTPDQGVPLQQTDIPRAAAVLARAFDDDPGAVWILPKPGQRRRILHWNFSKLLQHGLRTGVVHTTPHGLQGAAIWLPPERPVISLLDSVRMGFLSLPLKATPWQFIRFAVMASFFDGLHKQDVPKRHWYLNVLGVDPGRQGQGVGGRLIAPILEEADRQRLPCYLETGKEINVRFYRKHGFDVVREGDLPLGGPHWWTMLRQPVG